MSDAFVEDELLAALAAARPTLDEDALATDSAPAAALLDRIVSRGARTATAPRRHGRRWVAMATAAAVALAVVVGASLLREDTRGTGSPAAIPGQPVVLDPADVRRIASQSATALAGSGRATTTFVVDRGLPMEQRGAVEVAFAGDDLDMTLHFEGVAGRPAFDSATRTVDGDLYLLDGPPGAKRWYRDVNARGTRSSDLFSLDPRTLLAAVQPEGGFELVGREEIDGVAVRHLRATRLDELPGLNLTLGPIDPATIVRLEVWADDADVVRRLDVSTHVSETREAGAMNRTEVDAEGNKHKVVVSGSGEPVTTVHESSYSVRFRDVGAPIRIEAPADAVDVAGQG